MTPRVAGGILGLLVMLLIAMLVVSTVVEGAERWRPVMLGGGAVVGLASVAMLVLLLRSLSRTARGEEAEVEFESSVMKEMEGKPKPAPAPRVCAPAAAVSAAPEEPGTGGPPNAEQLLSQLRLARLDPLHEGELRQGPLSGTMLLRLGRGETAAVMPRVPSAEDWPHLFPRFDRVFYPLGDGRWACAERIEAFVADRIDLKL